MNTLFIRNFRSRIRVLERELELQLKSDMMCCGVTVSQCHVLMELSDRESASLKDLSGIFGLDKSTLSRTIDGMVEAGLVNRIPGKEDRRYSCLTLTDKGREKADSIHERCDRYYAELLRMVPEDKHTPILESLLILGDAMGTVRRSDDGGKTL